MRKIAVIGASALVLALGAATASAEPTTQQLLKAGDRPGAIGTHSPNAPLSEGRAAAVVDSIILEPHHNGR